MKKGITVKINSRKHIRYVRINDIHYFRIYLLIPIKELSNRGFTILKVYKDVALILFNPAYSSETLHTMNMLSNIDLDKYTNGVFNVTSVTDFEIEKVK